MAIVHGLSTAGERTVFRLICQRPGISRGEVSSLTGLTGAAVTQIVKRQIEAGWVEELGPEARSGPGRVPIRLAARRQPWRALGMAARRFDVTWALVDLSGRVDRCWHLPAAAAADLDACVAMLRRIEADAGHDGLAIVARGLGLPTFPLAWVHRAQLLALADRLWGAGNYVQGHNGSHAALAEEWANPALPDRFLYVFFGAGIGGALVTRQPPGQPPRVVPVEVGHVGVDLAGRRCICGNRGCVETEASPLALTEMAGLAGLKELHRVPARVPQRASHAVRSLAYGLASIVNVLDVGDIVLGGYPAETLHAVYGGLPELLAGRRTPSGRPIAISVSRLGLPAAAVGAALDAVDRLRWKAAAARLQPRRGHSGDDDETGGHGESCGIWRPSPAV